MGSGSSRRGSPRGPSVAVEVEATQDDVGDSKKPSTNGVHHHRPTSKAKSRTQPRGNKILFPDDYPRPLPPSDSRDDICCQTILNSIDDYIFDAPEDLLTGSYTNLVKYLVNDGKWGDVGKVRAIFRWITTIDIYGLLDKEAPVDTPLEYFQRIRKGTGNHAHLFAGLCKFAGLKCVIVNGINKSAAYEVGEKINRRKMAAQWNAIYLNGAWRFVDVFWASTCIVGRKTGKWTLLQYDGRTVDRRISRDDGRQEHRSNDFFFLTEPEQLIYTHFPNDSQWQLLNRPLTFEEFEEAAYVREMFFLMGLSFTDQSHHKCIVHADTGEVKIELGLPPNSEKYTFKYTVYLEEDNNDVRSFNDDVQLENFVLYQQSETFLRYSSRFPVAGTFKVDIYGHDASTSQTLDLLTSYIIKCKSPFPNCQPLPDTPAIGWGVGKKARDIGIRAKSHENGIIESADGTFEIRLKLEKEINLNQLILHNTINSEDLQHHAVTRIENGEVIVNVRLPAGNSQYALKLYANEASNEGEMENVCNYLLRSMAHPPQQSYPKLASAILGERPFNDKLGVTALTHVNGLIETTDGKVVLDFAKEKGVELSCELTNNDLFEEALKKCVQVEQDEDTARFTLSLNEIGEYGFNIYGRQSDDRRQIFNLHNYLIQKHYDETSERRALKPLRPPVGFKANVDDLTIQGDKAIENWKIVTADRKHKLRIPATSKKTIGELRRVNAVGTHLKGGVKIKRDADEDVVTLDLPDDGEYVLNIFEKRGKNVLSTTKTYHVVRDSSLVTGDDGLDIVSSDAESMDSCSTEIRQIVEEPEPKPPGPKRDDQEEIAAMQTIEEESPRLLVNKADDSAAESVDGDSDKDVESPVVAKTEEELEMERIEEENRIAEEAETKKARQKKRLTERLQEAMKVRLDVDRLSRAISNFISAGIENDALLAEGKRMLELWTLILNLNTGIRTRNIKLVEPAIQKAARHDDSELRNYVALAHRMMEQVRKIERLRHSILKLNQKTIAEIRAYSRPPPAVEQVMTASFLLMGEEEYELKDWKWIQCLMGRIGPDSVKKRVADTNVDDVPIEIALRAQQIYEGFTLNDVRDVSAGAAAFYVWTSGMIEACINNFKAAGGNLFSVRPKTCRRPGTRGRPFTMAGNRPQTQAGRRPATQATRPFTQGDIPRSESQVHQERRLSHELPPKPKITQW